MRHLLVLIIGAVILGGMQFYMLTVSSWGPAPGQVIERPATGDFRIQLTLSVDAGNSNPLNNDPFALDPTNTPALEVWFRGKLLLLRKAPISADEAIVIDVKDFIEGDSPLEGRNNINIKMTPANLEALVSSAVRVQVFRDDRQLLDKTLWSEPGQPVQGEIVAEIHSEAEETHKH